MADTQKLQLHRVNLNDTVYVALTDYAWGIVDKMANGPFIRSVLEANTHDAVTYDFLNCRFKITKMQLWELMQYFGRYITFPMEGQLFERNTIFMNNELDVFIYDEEEKKE